MLFWCRITADDILMKMLLIVTWGSLFQWFDLNLTSQWLYLDGLFQGQHENFLLILLRFATIKCCTYHKNFNLIFYGFYENLSYCFVCLVLWQHQLPLHFTIQFRKYAKKIVFFTFQRIFIDFYYIDCVRCVNTSAWHWKQTKNVLIASWMASDKFSWKIIKRCKLLFVCLYCHKCNCSLFFSIYTVELLTTYWNILGNVIKFKRKWMIGTWF